MTHCCHRDSPFFPFQPQLHVSAPSLTLDPTVMTLHSESGFYVFMTNLTIPALLDLSARGRSQKAPLMDEVSRDWNLPTWQQPTDPVTWVCETAAGAVRNSVSPDRVSFGLCKVYLKG